MEKAGFFTNKKMQVLLGAWTNFLSGGVEHRSTPGMRGIPFRKAGRPRKKMSGLLRLIPRPNAKFGLKPSSLNNSPFGSAFPVVALLLVRSPVVAALNSEPPPETVAVPTTNAETDRRLSLVYDRSLGLGGDEVFSLHKLNYALIGGNDLKLQYSFKLKVVRDAGLFVAYTNYMVWKIYEESIPVKDNNFNPEMFCLFAGKKEGVNTFDAGCVHLSNGATDADSRSLDRLFFRFAKGATLGPRGYLVSSNIYFWTLAQGEYTRTYEDFLGWWDTSFWVYNIFGQKDGRVNAHVDITTGKNGVPFNHGNLIAGVHWRLPGRARFNPTLYAQYFTGYGELIRFYSTTNTDLRAGISFYY